MITVSYNAYCATSKEGDNDIWTVRPRGVVPPLPLCSQIDVGTTVNALHGDTFSRENNTHRSRFHDRDPQFASRILGTMTQSCYILWNCPNMSLDFTDKSTLVQVMAWCHQATSHYLSQCWPRSMLPNGVPRPQWVKHQPWVFFLCLVFLCLVLRV